MAEAHLKLEVKNLKRELFRARGRWLKLQRETVGEALEFATRPIVEAAKAAAPVLQSPKRGRVVGLLRSRIGAVSRSTVTGRTRLFIGPQFVTRNEKAGPFYARFQEKGWYATGRARRSKAKRRRLVPGRHFLRNAALAHTAQAFTVFKARIIQKFQQSEGASAV